MAGVFTKVANRVSDVFGTSPRKQTPVPANISESKDQMGSPDLSQSRGIKRQRDIYDVDDTDEVVVSHGSAKRTPISSKARRESSAPNSVYSSAGRIKRRSRPSGMQQETIDPRVDAQENLHRAIAPDAVRLQPELDTGNSVHVAVPEAVMGDSSDLFNPIAGPASSTPSRAEITRSSPSKEPKSSKRSSRQATKEADTVEAAAPKREDAAEDEIVAEEVKEEEVEEEQEEQQQVEAEDADDGEVAEVQALLAHKLLDDKTVDIRVHWAGEDESQATWEPEFEIQNGASELLFKYWKDQGGRTRAVFSREGLREEYHIFKILGHEKMPKGGFKLEIQWVGYPATKGQTTMEIEKRVEQIAPEMLEEYWESRGGRSSFLSKRGRTKKARKN